MQWCQIKISDPDLFHGSMADGSGSMDPVKNMDLMDIQIQWIRTLVEGKEKKRKGEISSV
jgi:hypothetical protein